MNADPSAASILIVDDSANMREVLRRNLEAEGFHVRLAGEVGEALRRLKEAPADLVITDVRMPGVSGLELVRHVRENETDTEIVVITAYPEVDGALRAMKLGAIDYLGKPFTDSELLGAVSQAMDRLRMRRTGSSGEPSPPEVHGLIGDSAAMQGLARQIQRASRTEATVLITGESGTGKELAARAVHYSGSRAAAPFVPINCGAIPRELMESELFGHLRGSFTGASESRAGFFITADGGTIFLDEIGETDPAMQVKLLRVLQDKEVRMVGSTEARKVDVRIIAATNRDLELLVKKGQFREDLYFRLNVIGLRMPPLRERGEDVTRLVRHFAERFAAELGRSVPRFTDHALQLLRQYAWPGNVRELENVIQRLLVMTDGEQIEAVDLPAGMKQASFALDHGEDLSLAQLEERHILSVLERTRGNKSRAAQILGIDRKTLRHRLQQISGSGESDPGA